MKHETEAYDLAEEPVVEAFALVNVESELDCLLISRDECADEREFLQRVAMRTGGDKHMRVILYCTGGHREASTRAAHWLTQAGYTEVLEYCAGQEIWHSSPRGFCGQPGNPIASGDHRGETG